jgi:hypothetical protein
VNSPERASGGYLRTRRPILPILPILAIGSLLLNIPLVWALRAAQSGAKADADISATAGTNQLGSRKPPAATDSVDNPTGASELDECHRRLHELRQDLERENERLRERLRPSEAHALGQPAPLLAQRLEAVLKTLPEQPSAAVDCRGSGCAISVVVPASEAFDLDRWSESVRNALRATFGPSGFERKSGHPITSVGTRDAFNEHTIYVKLAPPKEGGAL